MLSTSLNHKKDMSSKMAFNDIYIDMHIYNMIFISIINYIIYYNTHVLPSSLGLHFGTKNTGKISIFS